MTSLISESTQDVLVLTIKIGGEFISLHRTMFVKSTTFKDLYLAEVLYLDVLGYNVNEWKLHKVILGMIDRDTLSSGNHEFATSYDGYELVLIKTI